MLHGLLNLSPWQLVIAGLILTHITIVSVTIFLHRSQAHRGVELHAIPSHFFRFWLWMTTGMVTKEWVAIHRKHHAECETENDPHSPVILGIKTVLFEGAELYRRESKNAETLERYGRGTPDDWLERNLYTPYTAKGIFLMLAINLLLFGIPGVTIWAAQMAWIPLFAAGVVNGLGHFWGYRNHEVPDASTNIVPWGILIGGEELHNNHHTYPVSAKFSLKWWELDIGWVYISLLSLVGLAKVKKVPPKPHIIPAKASIDDDTLMALITNKFQVMARYSKDVLVPVFKAEKRKAGTEEKGIFSRVKSLLIKESSLVDEKGRQRLTNILEGNDSINLVYQYRLKLQEIWSRTTSTQKELLEALQEWCKQAEETGIEVLRDFVVTLRTYSV